LVRTYGLSHIALAVTDVARSSAFYQAVFGMKPVYEDPGVVQLQTPGTRDVLVLERGPAAGKTGAVSHFGFRLRRPSDIDQAIESVRGAGGAVRDHGTFIPGEPYLFATDPDGNEFEIWFEIPTRLDPRRTIKSTKRQTASRKRTLR
jgi:catechol 2,3-dioxygenase-like lactoylglutathione lyase family enzyme